jgi:tetraacyldisaccharide 4'-kinase
MKLKKPNFWDLKQPNYLTYLLLPLTLLIRLNNIFLKFTPKKKFKRIKSICIGNIYLGGTGKTPTTLKVYELLKNLNYQSATAKKLYLDQEDERTLLKNKTKLITSKKRVKIFENAIKNNYDFIIFDDGLQDKTVEYDVKFVCFDAINWIGNGYLIPSGPLREKLDSLKKYDGVFLKSLSKNSNSDKISSFIKKFNPNIKIFHSYVNIKNINKFNLFKKYLIFSGIGNPNSFKELLIKNKFNVVEEIIFPDHYNYKYEDFKNIEEKAKILGANIITTEKDFVKVPLQNKKNISSLEISLNIIEENQLIEFIKTKTNEIY